MWYELNVSLNGSHLFGTDKRSLTTWEKAEELRRIFCKKFPVYAGYEITMTRWEQTGTVIV
jgi:hypothetical protein